MFNTFQEHPVVLTIWGTSCIATTKCRPVGQGGFGSKRVAPEEGSPARSGGPPYHVGADKRVEAHGLTTHSSL